MKENNNKELSSQEIEYLINKEVDDFKKLLIRKLYVAKKDGFNLTLSKFKSVTKNTIYKIIEEMK